MLRTRHIRLVGLMLGIALVVGCLLACPAAHAGRGPGGGGRGGPGGPPPEAATACSGKSSGDTCSFTTPRGDAVSGTCTDFNGALSCRPADCPNGQAGQGRGFGPGSGQGMGGQGQGFGPGGGQGGRQ
ncbi:MAG: hypothetical protein AB7E47_04940 [Desulfovibrionaceae bacterium]